MSRRLVQFQIVLLAVLGVLLVRLSHLQLVRGSHYRRLAEDNRLRVVPEQAPRGLIVDRQGRILASNQTIFRVAVIPQEVEDLPSLLERVGTRTRQSVEALQRAYTRERWLSFVPATVVALVPKETALRLEEERWQSPGLLVKPDTVRRYPLGQTAAQLLGYLSQPTAEELPQLKSYGVRPKHLVGRAGLERLLDHDLLGRPGGLVVEVNNRARQMREIGRRRPQPGARVTLTIDAQLQSLIEQAFGAQPGAAVVLDPETGEVLAMVSMPTFTPESFALLDARAVRRFLNDPARPLVNRAAAESYQPGSIIKLVTAAAALEHNLITPQTTITCPGRLTIGDRMFHCWNRDGHGPMTLPEALMQSCNVYFMQVSRWLGRDRLRAALEQAGLSKKTGWILEEQAGHLPTRRLTEGEIALLGIGQGEILVTVLQEAVLAGALANRGWLVQPWVVSAIGDQSVGGQMTRRRLGWSADTIEAVRIGMQEVVRNPAGTGHRAFTPGVTMAGKTGTAQTHIPEQTHGWFVGFCPVDQPTVALAVMAEHGGSGGELPAEIARTICEYVTR